jgi:Predicted acyltransferase
VDALEIVWVSAGDPRMAEANDLRHAVLYEPFGVPRTEDWGDADASVRLVVVTRAGRVVGFASLVLEEAGSARVRQVSVAFDAQGTGVGRALMREVEAEARRSGVTRLWLEARTTAEGFYHRLGYVTVSDVHPSGRTGVPHVTMELPLA